MPLWKKEPNMKAINQLIADKLRDNDEEFFQFLPNCEVHHGLPAYNYCEGCKGNGPLYFCNDNCLDSEFHDHFPKKIPHWVLELKARYANLEKDLDHLILLVAQAKEPYSEVIERLDEMTSDDMRERVEKRIQEDIEALNTTKAILTNMICGDQEREGTVAYMVEHWDLKGLLAIEPRRITIGNDIDELRYLLQIDEERIYLNYKETLEKTVNGPALYKDLSPQSEALMARLKLRASESQRCDLEKRFKELERVVEGLRQKVAYEAL